MKSYAFITSIHLPSLSNHRHHRLSNSCIITHPVPSRTSLFHNQINESHIYTFVITCGRGDTDTIEEMQPLIKSAILHSSHPLRFILITDEESGKNASTLFKKKIPTTNIQIIIEISIISPQVILDWTKQFKYNACI